MKQTNTAVTPENHHSDEIDLIALLKRLWNGKRIIFYSLIASCFLGLIIGLVTPEKFTASVSFVPQISGQNQSAGGLSGLAKLAGIDLGSISESDELSPYVYPLIINSIPFQLDLMHSPLNFTGFEKPFSIYKYLIEINTPSFFSLLKKYTIGLPSLILKAFKKENDSQGFDLSGSKVIYKFTEQEKQVSLILEEIINLNINEKDSYISLSSTFDQPLVTAQLTEKVMTLLQDHITQIKISKAKDNLSFLKERMKEKELGFKKVQQELVKFSDKNKDVTSVMSSMKQQNLQSEYSLAFGVYSELAKQIEQAEIQVKKDTPILTIVQPVEVPDKRSSPKRLLNLIILMFLSIIISSSWILIKEPLGEILTQIKS
jgi:uncharacterized protein involved in exopolysaccharide biosynthesis